MKHRINRVLQLSLLLSLLCSCASLSPKDTPKASSSTADNTAPTVVGFDEYKDPLESYNRFMFTVNNGLYQWVLVPIGRGYDYLVPPWVQQRFARFFSNLASPVYAVSNLLAGEPANARDNLYRFTINTTVGLVGFFDPADHWLDIKEQEEHLEGALMSHGVGYGAFLVLPVIGPSDMRNAPSLVFDFVVNPISYYNPESHRYALRSINYVEANHKTLKRYPELHKKAEDPYLYFRNLYLQGKQRNMKYGQ